MFGLLFGFRLDGFGFLTGRSQNGLRLLLGTIEVGGAFPDLAKLSFERSDLLVRFSQTRLALLDLGLHVFELLPISTPPDLSDHRGSFLPAKRIGETGLNGAHALDELEGLRLLPLICQLGLYGCQCLVGSLGLFALLSQFLKLCSGSIGFLLCGVELLTDVGELTLE